MKVEVNISSEILNWVAEQIEREMFREDVRDKIRLWQSGEKKPTFNQIEKISKATGIPLGYFFLQTPPSEDLSLVEYRTVDSIELENPSRNLIETMHDMELVQEWTRNHIISEESVTLPFIGKFKKTKETENFAEEIRKVIGINKNWYEEVRSKEEAFHLFREAISSCGVIVMMSGIVGNNTRRVLDINEFRAFTIIDDYAPLIFINANDSINGRVFSLLHEFVHICIGESSLYNDRYTMGAGTRETEKKCNVVAAELLVPSKNFVKNWNRIIKSSNIDETISILTKKYKCGNIVIARKAVDNSLIDSEEYNRIVKLAIKNYNDRKESKGSGGDYYRTIASRIDQRFFEMLKNSVISGDTLYTEAFRLTNTNRSTFTNLVEKVEGEV